MPMGRINLTFRLKILFSLTIIVTVFLGILLVVVRNQTAQQIRWVTGQTITRSHQAYSELERLYQEQLQWFVKRISENNRVPVILQEAVEEEDPQLLAEAAGYELELAQIPMAVFTDETGQPIITLLNGKVTGTESESPALPAAQLEKLLREDSFVDYVSGYQMVGRTLFITYGKVLKLFGRTIGSVIIGFPVDDALAWRIGKVIQAEVAFLVNGKFLASSHLNIQPGLKEQMTLVAHEPEPVQVTLEKSRWLLISEPLNFDTPGGGHWVMAVPLMDYLKPFYRIETVVSISGLVMLAIALFLGISISRGLTAPVRELVEATKRVGRGEYDFAVNIKTKDELSTLARSFNHMTHGLLLKEQYRGILNKVVSPDIAEEMVDGNITLGGENRVVTTLFADIRGFTTITEGMEPQEVIAMLNQFMGKAADAVDARGGVVDKYVGDQIMALFGAPVSRPDDPFRAVSAALKMRESIMHLNNDRKTSGLQEVNVGIGINTGMVVAGNMGSVNRLNYTVLGKSVNIAARLCSQAGPSDILISHYTYKEVAQQVETELLPPLKMKGLSQPVRVHKVQRLLLMIVLLLTVMTNSLIPGESDNKWQVNFSGRVFLSGFLPQEEPSYLIDETEPFISGRLSLFADVFAGSRLYGLVELQADRGEIPSNGPIKIRIQQAFLRYTLLSSRSLHLQIGKFVTPFGDYAQRHHSRADPFIRPPLIHEYRTMICPGIAPGNNDGFIRWKFNPDFFRPIGAPIIWGVPYQAGVMLFGSSGKFFFRLAMMNSAPSSDPVQWDLDFSQEWNYSLVAHAGWNPMPELTLGISYNYGPYSLAMIEATLPPGYGINDYNQIMWAFNAAYTRGRIAVRMELIHDTWQVPKVYEDPVDISYYLEIKYKFLPGFFGAFRYNGIHFNKIAYTTGDKEKWDYNVQRWELGLGYSFSRRLDVRVQYMLNRTTGPSDPSDNLFALQWRLRF